MVPRQSQTGVRMRIVTQRMGWEGREASFDFDIVLAALVSTGRAEVTVTTV
jgi:hypothetical protein